MYGKRIEQLRTERGWTQEQLAERAGLGQSSIALIENGLRWPRESTLNKLAAAFGCDVSNLAQAPSPEPTDAAPAAA